MLFSTLNFQPETSRFLKIGKYKNTIMKRSHRAITALTSSLGSSNKKLKLATSSTSGAGKSPLLFACNCFCSDSFLLTNQPPLPPFQTPITTQIISRPMTLSFMKRTCQNLLPHFAKHPFQHP